MLFGSFTVYILVSTEISETKAMSTKQWRHRPAIIWDSSNHRLREGNNNICYWDELLLSQLSSADSFSIEKEYGKSSISYDTLLSTTAYIVSQFRDRILHSLPTNYGIEAGLHDANQQPQQKQKHIGVPLAVAIPEGPLLPLALLVVHALNLPTRPTKDNHNTGYAVLVPLEPSEGRDRLIHMLKDVKPSMIFCLPGRDKDKLQEIISSIVLDEETTISADGLLQPEEIELVDFSEVVQEAIEYSQNHLKQSDKANLEEGINNMNLKDDDLLSLVDCFIDLLSGSDREAESLKIPHEPSLVLDQNRISHVVYTSGTTGNPKGCVSSIKSLQSYLNVKNESHCIAHESVVLLASALSFDPCLSDILATFQAKGTLAVTPRTSIVESLSEVLKRLYVTHILCTPTLWSIVHSTSVRPKDFPSLKVLALGGEPIPKQILQSWARLNEKEDEDSNYSPCRLFSTYGVTEACVYQTVGEVFQQSTGKAGQDVGLPLKGLGVRICNETEQNILVDTNLSDPGEIIIYGSQLDEKTSYLNRPDLSHKFAREVLCNGLEQYLYRTGDRGYIDQRSGHLHILGRIQGEEGMVKINGVRVELGEIEAAVVDDRDVPNSDLPPLITSCIASTIEINEGSSGFQQREVHAFCVLSKRCLDEVLGSANIPCITSTGVLVTGGPLLTLLHSRCAVKIKAACTPSAFIIIPAIPLSPTGKRDRRSLPKLNDCVTLNALLLGEGEHDCVPLCEYGTAGKLVAEQIVDCLNLQPCQEVMLTTSVNFSMLGGDSLAATRVIRAIYANHHQVANSRFLGGAFGEFKGPFAVTHLLRAQTLGDYVDMLDSNHICSRKDFDDSNGQDSGDAANQARESMDETLSSVVREDDGKQSELYDALMQAITNRQTRLAAALLDIGANPNLDDHGGRLGKVSGRNNRRRMFRSSPMHLSCANGDTLLVQKLLEKKSRFNSPDATGSFPLHLLACRIDGSESNTEEDLRRLECVTLLLDAGAPMKMQDGSKQTVLHCAARAGHSKLLTYVMKRWQEQNKESDPTHKKHFFNWRDHWDRTPVHWAVLNGRVEALKVLLQMGCSASPPARKAGKKSSVASETPLDICNRVYDESNSKGVIIRQLLLENIKSE